MLNNHVRDLFGIVVFKNKLRVLVSTVFTGKLPLLKSVCFS